MSTHQISGIVAGPGASTALTGGFDGTGSAPRIRPYGFPGPEPRGSEPSGPPSEQTPPGLRRPAPWSPGSWPERQRRLLRRHLPPEKSKKLRLRRHCLRRRSPETLLKLKIFKDCRLSTPLIFRDRGRSVPSKPPGRVVEATGSAPRITPYCGGGDCFFSKFLKCSPPGSVVDEAPRGVLRLSRTAGLIRKPCFC